MITYVIQSACGCHFETSPTGQIFRWCPLHKSAPRMYEALKKIVAEGTRCLNEFQQDKPVREIYNIDEIDRIARQALAEADGGTS